MTPSVFLRPIAALYARKYIRVVCAVCTPRTNAFVYRYMYHQNDWPGHFSYLCEENVSILTLRNMHAPARVCLLCALTSPKENLKKCKVK